MLGLGGEVDAHERRVGARRREDDDVLGAGEAVDPDVGRVTLALGLLDVEVPRVRRSRRPAAIVSVP